MDTKTEAWEKIGAAIGHAIRVIPEDEDRGGFARELWQKWRDCTRELDTIELAKAMLNDRRPPEAG